MAIRSEIEARTPAAANLIDAMREIIIAAEAAGWDVGDNAPILDAARAALAEAMAGA